VYSEEGKEGYVPVKKVSRPACCKSSGTGAGCTFEYSLNAGKMLESAVHRRSSLDGLRCRVVGVLTVARLLPAVLTRASEFDLGNAVAWQYSSSLPLFPAAVRLKVTINESTSYMCELYERCQEAHKKTLAELESKYLQPLGSRAKK
jgi:hypothetical protein